MRTTRLPGLALAGVFLAVPFGDAGADGAHYEGRSEYRAPKALLAPIVDGIVDEAIWAQAEWRAIDQRWLGPEYSAADFAGRFKVVWTDERIYILAEIVDDVLIDTHRDPSVQYWDDDCLEIYLDEDYSGGEHQYSHNAFAYHLSLDNQVYDFGTDKQPHSYSPNVASHWRQYADKLVWEAGIYVYDDTYVDESNDNVPLSLSAGKVLGLMLAWNDNDGSELRENFVGSETVLSGATDRGYIDAGLFGALVLAGAP